ncbi:unnamed protein product, partial [Allacma fusca]
TSSLRYLWEALLRNDFSTFTSYIKSVRFLRISTKDKEERQEMKFRRYRRSARTKAQRVSKSRPVHLNQPDPLSPALFGQLQMEDKLHTGFESYRRQSRHLLDVQTQIPENANSNARPLTLTSVNKRSTTKQLGSQYSRQDVERITFNPQEEVKEFMVQQRSYNKLGKDPFGLEILLHADQLWLEHASPSTVAAGISGSGSLPLYDYQYSVYDDSEQRILFIRPESFNQFRNLKPKNYVIFSAIGTDVCKLHVAPPFCCSSKQIEVEITKQERKIGSVSLLGNCFKAYDRRGDKVMTINVANSKKKSRFRFCPSFEDGKRLTIIDPDIEFLCDIFATDGRDDHMGIIRQNDIDPQKRVRGEPAGFYCMLNERQGSKSKIFADDDSIGPGHTPRTSSAENNNKNMLKLNIIVALLILMVYFKPTSSVRTSTETDSRTTSSAKGSI